MEVTGDSFSTSRRLRIRWLARYPDSMDNITNTMTMANNAEMGKSFNAMALDKGY